jgi:outer membrane protein insertion porin family
MALTRTTKFDSDGNPLVDIGNSGMARIDFGPAAIGGDFMYVGNFEYRIPIAGPLSVSPFYDIGSTLVTRRNQLKVYGETSDITLIDETNSVIRSSVGLEVQFLLPVVQAPFRLIFAFNPNRLVRFIDFGSGRVPIHEPRKDIKFTIGRSF